MAHKQFVKRFTAVVGLGLVAYLFLFITQAAEKVAVWRQAATCQSSAQLLSGGIVVFQHADPAECIGSVPAEGDTLVTLADSAATMERWYRFMDSPQPPGLMIPLEYLHNGERLHTEIMLRLPTTAEFLLLTVLQSLRFLIALLFMSVALWAFFARPDSAGVRALALFSFAMTAFMISSIETLSGRWATFQIPYQPILQQILHQFSILFGAFWLNLTLQFPRPVHLLRAHPVLAYSLCYVPSALLLAAIGAVVVLKVALPLNLIALLMLAAQIAGGMIILGIRHWKATERIEKRQTRLVLWGTGTGLALLFLLMLVAQVFHEWLIADQKRGMVVVNISFLGLLLSPVSYVYALGRYRLLEVEARLRRGTRYVIAMTGMLVVLAVAGYAGSAFARQASALGSVWSGVVLTLVSLGLVLGGRRAREFIVDRFYPERRRLRDLFHDFLQHTYMMTDARTFWRELEVHLQDGLMVEGVYPLVRAQENGAFLCRDFEHTPFHAGCDLADRLERERKPIMVDEAVATSRVKLTDEESDWLAQRRIAVVLPLLAHTRLIGFLGLGMKTERDDYAAEELRLLDSLAPQVALASENIRLLEENVGKKRLEEQLAMARRVQHGFLPRQIPYCPGLDVAARCRFCLEVAGDYYDIIPLPTGETVLAVGDVSGKGAGAALLMANLQASLRTAVGMGIPLTDIVSRINELIHRNTPPEQFITFFVGMFDPVRMEFTYVNAGHNPPLLLRRDGVTEALDVGGLLLGTFLGFAYHQATVPLSKGDVLLMYTDGVSEAMSEHSEEFGEDRIRTLLREHATHPPDAILDDLERRVLQYTGSDLLEDDFTLLAAKVTG
ncbi:MAG TPA: GAF domain-containing SpoIIE family protein phosphatase [bacterium]